MIECPVCGYLTPDLPCDTCGASKAESWLNNRSALLTPLKLKIGHVFSVFAILTAIVMVALTCDHDPAFPMDVDHVAIMTVALESSGESLEAQTYVAAVIRTRAKERKLTYEQVCLQPYQFSCWNKGTKQKPRTAKEYETARRAWELSEAVAERPNLYHDTSVSPAWAYAKSVHFVKAIGRLRFYREDV